MKKRKRGKIMHSKKHKSQMSIIEFQKTYDTEDKCREELFKMRYPKGFKFSKCECTEYYYLKSRGKYQWKNCKHQSGTVMDRSHLKLTVWLWAIYLFSNDKRGSSACYISQVLKLSYKNRLVCTPKAPLCDGRTKKQVYAFGNCRA